MRTVHLIGFRSDGTSCLLIGPEVPVGEALRKVSEFRVSKALPAGIVQADPYDSERGRLTPILAGVVQADAKQTTKTKSKI